jgi:hypothetical protein
MRCATFHHDKEENEQNNGIPLFPPLRDKAHHWHVGWQAHTHGGDHTPVLPTTTFLIKQPEKGRPIGHAAREEAARMRAA